MKISGIEHKGNTTLSKKMHNHANCHELSFQLNILLMNFSLIDDDLNWQNLCVFILTGNIW